MSALKNLNQTETGVHFETQNPNYPKVMSEGKKREICGNIIKTARVRKSIKRKGIIPIKISWLGISGATLFTT